MRCRENPSLDQDMATQCHTQEGQVNPITGGAKHQEEFKNMIQLA